MRAWELAYKLWHVFRPFTKLSARMQWTTILSALTIVLLTAEAVFIWYVFQDGLRESVDRSRDLARTVAAKMEVIIADDKLILEKLAQLPDIQNFNENKECDPVFRYFNDFRAQEFERVSLLALDGSIVCDRTRIIPGRDNVIREQEWFRKGLAADGFAIGRAYKAMPTNRMIIPLTHPVRDRNGAVVGLLILTLDLQVARDRIFQSLPNVEDLRALVVDDNQQYLIHTDVARIGEQPDVSYQQYVPITDTTARVYGADQKWRLVGMSYVAGTSWRAFVGIPEELALAGAREATWYAAGFGILVIILFATPFIWFGWSSVKRDETARQQVDELNELQAFMWANIPEGAAFFNDNGIILDANDQLAVMLGRPRAEIIGRKLNEFTQDPRTSERASVRDRGYNQWTTVFKRPDGTLIEIESKVQSFAADDRKLYIGVFRDFTELKRAEEELRKSEELLEQTGRVAAVGGWELDLRTMTPRWTQETKRLHEVPMDFVPNIDQAINFYPGKARQKVTDAVEKAIKHGTPYDIEVPFVTARGHKLWVRTQGRAILENGKITRLIGTIQDFTSKRVAQRQLEEARAKAEIASKAKSSFIAIMSHEIRTPLTGILGMADLLNTEDLTPRQKSLVERLLRSGRVLLDLINDVLDFSKIEANKLTIERHSFVPADIFNSVQELLDPIAQEKTVALEFTVADTLNQRMLGDPKRLRQILVNLTGNALKFTQKGSVSVTAECHPGDNSEMILDVAVADTGIGISPADQKNLFKPYVQAEQSSTAQKIIGTGLGLSISRLLVEAMGGQITVVSAEGIGSTFSFTIKLQQDRTQTLSAQRTLQSSNTDSLRPLKILAAEDNETSRYLIQTMLERKGHQIQTVENGALAVDAAKSAEFDIILMDMQMPVMDGKDAVREIRKLGGHHARIPIIALTADMVDENRATYYDAGVNSIIGKPVDWSALDAEMNLLLHEQAQPVPTSGSTTPTVNSAPRTITDVSRPRIDYDSLEAVAELLGTEKFVNLLNTFRDNLLQYRTDLHRNVVDNDLYQVRRTAHSLKGLSLQFGAITVGQMAAAMEADAMGIKEIAAALPDFDMAVDITLKEMSRPELIDELMGTNVSG
jgi:PAS domain S-box-containing protein